MTEYTNEHRARQTRNAEILERLRASFGEEQDSELADIDGLGMLSLLLRPLPEKSAAGMPNDEGKTGGDRRLTRADRAALFQQRRKQQRKQKGELNAPIVAENAVSSTSYAKFLEQLPQLREHFADWLASIDTDYVGSSSTLDELKELKRKTEQRLHLLNVMAAESQRELDQIIINIRVMESARSE